MPDTLNDRPPNFRERGRLYLVRCFNCTTPGALIEGWGRENYGPAVPSGSCAWCGWTDPDAPSTPDDDA